MIDFHCHILPGIDDGSRNVTESLAMLTQERQQGIDTIVFTSHFYAHHDSVEAFLKRRDDSYQKLTAAMEENQIELTTYLGAEVYYFGGIGKAEMIPQLCIAGTDILLLEMPFCQWTRDMYEDINRLLQKQKVQVVMAHIERYFEFQKDRKVMEQVLALPVTLQINAGSFLRGASFMDFAGKKKVKLCLGLLQEGRDVLLGSDAHNMQTRLPNIKDGRQVIAEKLGEEALVGIDSLGERMLGQNEN